jgi:hypothetical protein
MYIKPIMSRVPIRRGGGGGGLTLVIILVLMMCVSVIVGAGGYVLFKPKKPVVPKTLTAAEKTKAADDAQAAADALAADPDATPAEVAAAQAAAAAAADAAADDTEEETPAAVNCVGTWSGWGDCSQDCGGGIQTKEWTTTTEPLHGGTVCPSPSTETQVCNEQACPVATNCVGTWSGWGACSETCGGGIQTKEWTTTTEPLHGGTVCPSPSTETQVCNEQACPVATNCIGAWSGWGACSETCGGGIQSQNYEVSTDETNGGTCTERGQTNEKPCNEQACPIGDNGFDNETFYIKDVEDRYVGAYGARNIMGHGYWYPKASYTLDGSLDETTIQSGGKYCLGFDNRINCSGGSGDDRGNFKLEKQSDGGFKIYNEGLGAYIGLTKDVLYKEIDKAKYPDDKQNMILYLERVP